MKNDLNEISGIIKPKPFKILPTDKMTGTLLSLIIDSDRSAICTKGLVEKATRILDELIRRNNQSGRAR